MNITDNKHLRPIYNFFIIVIYALPFVLMKLSMFDVLGVIVFILLDFLLNLFNLTEKKYNHTMTYILMFYIFSFCFFKFDLKLEFLLLIIYSFFNLIYYEYKFYPVSGFNILFRTYIISIISFFLTLKYINFIFNVINVDFENFSLKSNFLNTLFFSLFVSILPHFIKNYIVLKNNMRTCLNCSN
jgi:hypothetical protein